MRLLLASNASYDPPKGGSTRGNLAWLRPMAARGHEVRVVCPADVGAASHESVKDGISIHAVKDLSFHHRALAEEIRTLVRTRLSQHEYPRQIEFVTELPKTPAGKINRKLLRERQRTMTDGEAVRGASR